MTMWPEDAIRSPLLYFAMLANLFRWPTPSDIWAMYIMNRDVRNWQSLVMRKHSHSTGSTVNSLS